MKVSTRFRYGLRAVLEIASHGGGEAVSIARIAQTQDVSAKYLEHIIRRLLRGGLVESHMGAHGGYRLGRPAAAITLLDVMEAVGDHADVVECVSRPETCDRSGDCATREVWCQVSEQIRATWRGVTVADLLRRTLHDPSLSAP